MAEKDAVSLSLELSGTDLDLRTVGTVSQKLQSLLAELETGVTGEHAKATWHWEDEAVLRAVASVNGASHETLSEVAATARAAFESVDIGLPLPDTVNRRAAKGVRDILAYLDQLERMTLHAGNTEPLELEPHRDRARQVGGATTYTEVSSIDGTLDLISIRRGAHFGIEEHGTRNKIRCSFDGDLLEDVKNALGKRVVVEGAVRFRMNGTPTSIYVTSLFLRPVAESIRRLKGSMPGFTGELSAEEYVRQLRTADGEE